MMVNQTNQTHLTVVSINDPPFNFYSKTEKKWTGMMFDLFDELQRLYGFRYTVVTPEDGAFGADIGNGTYNGMIGMLQRQEADVALAVLSATSERTQVVNFAPPVFHSGFSLMMSAASVDKDMSMFSYYPFYWGVWVVLIFAVLALSVILYAFARAETYIMSTRQKESDGREAELNLTDYILMSLGSVTYQATSARLVRYPGTRVLSAAMWLWGIVFMATYCGNLVSFLASPRVPDPVTNLEDALARGVRVGIQQHTSLSDLLSKSPNPVHQRTWQSIVKHDDFYVTYREGYMTAKSSAKFAYLEWDETYYSFEVNEDLRSVGKRCDFVKATEKTFPLLMSFAIAKNCSYEELFSQGVIRLMQTGISQYLLRKWRGSFDVTCPWQETKSQSIPVDYNNVTGAYFLLFAGLAAGAATFFMEFLTLRFKEATHHDHRDATSPASDSASVRRRWSWRYSTKL